MNARNLRFSFLRSILGVLLSIMVLPAAAQPSLEARIEGMLIGALIGDAAGGPDEFQPPERSMWTKENTRLTADGRRTLADRFALKPYTRRPLPEPYGQWTAQAPIGTLTDDSRFKRILMNSLEEAGKPDREAFARSLLDWHADSTSRYGSLPQDWLDEFAYAARWELGERDPSRARPPERQWGGIPTMAGQMPFLPVAALTPANPEAAYEITWALDFLDNGIGRDINAALVAGLAEALAPEATFQSVEKAIRETDPYGFGEIDWVPRRLTRWLDKAHDMAERAEGVPSRLYALFETELQAVTWWEAWVPITIVFASAKLAEYDPLATMQLILEFGRDTDSYLQVAGALFGALHGPNVFPAPMRQVVTERLRDDYDASLAHWIDLLKRTRTNLEN